jgi:hypothetical protein
MPFLLGRGSDFVGERQRVFEVFESEQPVEFRNTVLSLHLPVGDLRLELFDFLRCNGRSANAARFTFLFDQFFHLYPSKLASMGNSVIANSDSENLER